MSMNVGASTQRTFDMPLQNHISSVSDTTHSLLFPELFPSDFPLSSHLDDLVPSFSMAGSSSDMYPRTVPQSFFLGNGFAGQTHYPEPTHYPVTSPLLGPPFSPEYAHTHGPRFYNAAPASFSSVSGTSMTSASSSTIGSPHSMDNHPNPTEQHWVGTAHSSYPTVVHHDGFTGHDYTYAPAGNGTGHGQGAHEPKGFHTFVGECAELFTMQHNTSGLMASPRPASSFPSLSSSWATTPPNVSMSALGGSNTDGPAISLSRSRHSTPCQSPSGQAPYFPTPSSLLYLPSSPRHEVFGGTQTSHYGPEMATSHTSQPSRPMTRKPWFGLSGSHESCHKSSFFSQSSGNYVPPLESSCSFLD